MVRQLLQIALLAIAWSSQVLADPVQTQKTTEGKAASRPASSQPTAKMPSKKKTGPAPHAPSADAKPAGPGAKPPPREEDPDGGKMRIIGEESMPEKPREASSSAPTGERRTPTTTIRPPTAVPVRPESPATGLPGGPERGIDPRRDPRSDRARPTPSATPTAESPHSGFGPPGRTGLAQEGAPPAAGARIRGVPPLVATVGQSLTVEGEGFGARGRVELEIAGARVRAELTRWSDHEVVLVIPAAAAPLVGGEERDGRLWLYADRGMATSELIVRPDLATLPPSIRDAPTSVEPGRDIVLRGERFLDRPGRVELRCTRRNFEGIVSSWSDSSIAVDPLGDLVGRIESDDCELVVTNASDLAARRPMRLEVRLETASFPLNSTCRSLRDWTARLRLPWGSLRNGWVVTGMEKSVDSPDFEIEWVEEPVLGTEVVEALVRCERVGSRYVNPDSADIHVIVSIEGPAGRPWGP